ncbi:uncharacterized protein PB18E9.04c-like isoform X40 [Haliotis rufescens]|uniref:uncharacterized protein PB18E9.04c-like isoform X40 n=1 Tax=Haliotis rufescens TaxID=6454 RepID=UPI00201F5F6F|nr:uncharacterized protein PB18E9.04c-like isoform X40 [Haliotis rufescens]
MSQWTFPAASTRDKSKSVYKEAHVLPEQNVRTSANRMKLLLLALLVAVCLEDSTQASGGKTPTPKPTTPTPKPTTPTPKPTTPTPKPTTPTPKPTTPTPKPTTPTPKPTTPTPKPTTPTPKPTTPTPKPTTPTPKPTTPTPKPTTPTPKPTTPTPKPTTPTPKPTTPTPKPTTPTPKPTTPTPKPTTPTPKPTTPTPKPTTPTPKPTTPTPKPTTPTPKPTTPTPKPTTPTPKPTKPTPKPTTPTPKPTTPTPKPTTPTPKPTTPTPKPTTPTPKPTTPTPKPTKPTPKPTTPTPKPTTPTPKPTTPTPKPTTPTPKPTTPTPKPTTPTPKPTTPTPKPTKPTPKPTTPTPKPTTPTPKPTTPTPKPTTPTPKPTTPTPKPTTPTPKPTKPTPKPTTPTPKPTTPTPKPTTPTPKPTKPTPKPTTPTPKPTTPTPKPTKPTPKPTHLRAANMPLVHPFSIICYANKSIQILKNSNYEQDLFVVGDVNKTCVKHTHHFTIDKQNVTLTSSCLDTKEGAFLIEVQDRPLPTTTSKPLVIGGKSSIVYRVTCIPDTDGDPVNVTMMPAVGVKANASELVLPDLQIGIFAKSETATPNMTTQLPSLTLASEVQLVIYNDLKGDRMSYMLIPSKCVAHPQNQPTVTLTLLNDNKTNCTYENTLMSTFTVTNTTDYDLAYATLYPFTFQRYPDSRVVLECTVYICPKDDKVDGVRSGYCDKTQLNSGKRCSKLDAKSGYTKKKRRRRDVGVGDGGVTRATLRTTFTVQEPLMAGASRCSMGIWALVALMYLFK